MSSAVRSMSSFDVVKIFMNTGPSFLLALIFSVIFLKTAGKISDILQETGVSFPFHGLYIPGVALSAVVIVNCIRKFLKTKAIVYILRYGRVAYCELTGIYHTEKMEDEDAVLEYVFSYIVDGQKYGHLLESSSLYDMSTGSSYLIYYIPERPRKAYIPELNGLKSISADTEGPKNY